jgi:pyrroline-5-carboxylate reductase
LISPASSEAIKNVLLVGCGTIGSALLAGWIRQGIAPERVTVVDPKLPAVPAGVCIVHAPPAALRTSVLVLAIKPQALAEVAPAYVHLVDARTMILSVLAAVDIDTLRGLFPHARTVVRAVPNLPGAIGQGITALAGDVLNERTRAVAEAAVAPLGAVEWLEDEQLCDAATSVSGCGPAFLFRFAAAVAAAGEAQGLPRRQALRLIASTMSGAGAMLQAEKADPADLARRVASPGGVTLAGLKVLDGPGGLDALMADTLAAAVSRNTEMAREARAAILK